MPAPGPQALGRNSASQFSEVSDTMIQSEVEKRRAREALEFETANQTQYEARILVPEWDLPKLLAFCQDQLGQVPTLFRAGLVKRSPVPPTNGAGVQVETPKARTHRKASTWRGMESGPPGAVFSPTACGRPRPPKMGTHRDSRSGGVRDPHRVLETRPFPALDLHGA